jgi:WD40 repeat protein
MRVLTSHKKPITALAFSPDRALLAEAAHGGKVRVWDVSAGEMLHTFDEAKGLFPNQVKVAFAGRKFLAVANERAALIDLKDGSRIRLPGKSSSFHVLQTTADGKQMVSSGDNFQRWNLGKRELLKSQVLFSKGSAQMMTFPAATIDASGKRFAACRKNWADDGNTCDLAVFDAKTQKSIATFEWIGHEAKRLAFHPTRPLLAAACGPVLRVWNLESNSEVAAITVGKLHHFGAAFSPCGRHLAAVSKDRTVRFWDAATFAESKVFDWEIGKLLDLAFSPDGTVCAVASDSGKILLFDVE